MVLPDTICGVILFDDAYKTLGHDIDSYVKEGPRGKYIYCTTAVQNGSFLDMTFKPEQCDGSVKCNMTVSIPLHFVKMMVSGSDEKSMGFFR